MKKILLFLLFISHISFSQNAMDLFKKGNEEYKKGLYNEAIKTYEKIDSLGLQSSELYFNLGNCYYKLNKVAPTIYNYERALLVDPLNEDAKNNLVFAKRLTIDNIEALPKSVFQRIDESFIKKLSYNNWAMLSVVFSILGSLLFLLFYYAYSPSRKRLFFVSSILCFLFLIISLSITYKEYDFSLSNIEAIIFVEKTDIKNAPTDNSEDIFTLHEGTKVKVLDEVDNWKKIKIADGKIGWILSDNIRVLNFF